MLFIKRSAKPLLCLLGFWRNHWLYLILFNDVVLNKEKRPATLNYLLPKRVYHEVIFCAESHKKPLIVFRGLFDPEQMPTRHEPAGDGTFHDLDYRKKKNRAKKKRTQKQQGITTTITDKDPRESRQRCNECGMRRSEDLQPRPPPPVDRHSGNRERCNEVSPNKQLALA